MARQKKQLTPEEKAARLEQRAADLRAGNFTEISTIQLPLTDYLRTDEQGSMFVKLFPKKVKNVRYFVHVQRGQYNFKVWLKPSTAGSNCPIPVESIQPRVEFPSSDSIAWKNSAPSHFGSVSCESEAKKGADLVIGVTMKAVLSEQKKSASLEAELADLIARATGKAKK